MPISPNDVLDLAAFWSEHSKDPCTKVGAAVYNPTTGAVFLGYNGFPCKFPDTAEHWSRPLKYAYVRHAEVNAVWKAVQAGNNMSQSYLVCTHRPCHRCMVDAICDSGLRHVYYAVERPDEHTDLLAIISGISLVCIGGGQWS